MTRPRAELVSENDTPYYHCIGRYVRRAFLCGKDTVTGQDFSHRKAWVMERLKVLLFVFTIELCTYAVMSNHYHLVVHVDAKAAAALDDDAVMARWELLFALPLLINRYRAGKLTGEAERTVARSHIDSLRQRLCDLSWFMRCLNEHIARRANEEDKSLRKYCTITT